MAAKKSRPTFNKAMREAKLRERRHEKEARRDARKQLPSEGRPSTGTDATSGAEEERPSE